MIAFYILECVSFAYCQRCVDMNHVSTLQNDVIIDMNHGSIFWLWVIVKITFECWKVSEQCLWYKLQIGPLSLNFWKFIIQERILEYAIQLLRIQNERLVIHTALVILHKRMRQIEFCFIYMVWCV